MNSAALALLEESGLGNLRFELGAPSIEQIDLFVKRRHFSFSLPRGASLSRRALDLALVLSAIQKGTEFLPSTRASLGPLGSQTRELCLVQEGKQIPVKARIVLAADGLRSQFSHGNRKRRIPSSSHIGVGGTVNRIPDFYHPGKIFMAVGRGGYVGLVLREDGKLNLAAALDFSFIRQMSSPANAVRALLKECRMEKPDDIENLSWHGTPALTRRHATLAYERLFLIGDAAGFAEPFTGEGIAWALASAKAVVSLVHAGVQQWNPGLVPQWNHWYSSSIGRRQILCQWLTKSLGHTGLATLGATILSWKSSWARALIDALHHPFPKESWA